MTNDLWVRFSEVHASTSSRVTAIFDLTKSGDAVGIEIRDLCRQSGVTLIPPGPLDGTPRWVFDDEIDAFYIHLRDGRSEQRLQGTVTLGIGGSGRLVSLFGDDHDCP